MTTWVPPEKRDTRFYLFNKLFRCKVPNIQSMSPEYIRHIGMPTVGIPEYDRSMANELVDRMLSVAQMVDYHQKGVEVRVCNPADTAAIYDIVTNHLLAWKRALEATRHFVDAPIDDLIALDEFANIVHPHAKPFFTKDVMDSLLARRITSVSKFSRENVLPAPKLEVKRSSETSAAQPEPSPEEGRESMAKVFAARRRRLVK